MQFRLQIGSVALLVIPLGVLKHILYEKRFPMSDSMVGADDGIMVSQSGLTKRAVRSAQAKHTGSAA